MSSCLSAPFFSSPSQANRDNEKFFFFTHRVRIDFLVNFSTPINGRTASLNYQSDARNLLRTSIPSLPTEDKGNCSKYLPSIRDLCEGLVPEAILQRVEKAGFIRPTDVQLEAIPVLLSGRDCILHAQTGSGKTLAYLLLIFATVNPRRSSVQALVVVPTRELGMQIAKVARMLASVDGVGERSCTVMALLDGGLLKRHKRWLKAEPPTIMVATVASLCMMLEKGTLKLQSLQVLVIDEVDFMVHSSEQVPSLKKLLSSSCSSNSTRQTVFASASIPHHHQFTHRCVREKWTKPDVTHIHVNPVEPMPSRFLHRFVVCEKEERHEVLVSLLKSDAPKSGIVFFNDQSHRKAETGTFLADYLRASQTVDGDHGLEVHLVEERMNFNLRASSLSDVRAGAGRLLVATDVAARGVDLPETTHVYNYDVPATAVEYLHRAGRTGRNPFSDETCTVTTLISPCERFVLRKFENQLMFQCHQHHYRTGATGLSPSSVPHSSSEGAYDVDD